MTFRYLLHSIWLKTDIDNGDAYIYGRTKDDQQKGLNRVVNESGDSKK